MRPFALVSVVAVLSLTLPACHVTPPDAAAFVDHGVRSIDRSTEAQLGIARANPALDPTILAEAAGRFESDRSATRAELASLQLQLQQHEQRLRELMASLIDLTASVAPGGETALKVVNSIKAFIQLQSDESTAVNQTALDETSARIAEHDQHLADLRSRLDTISASVNQLTASLEIASADTVTHADLDSSLAQLELAALQLREQDRESLRQQIVQHAREQGLLQNAEFRAAFKDELLKAAKEQPLSPEDLERIAAMTPEQSLAAFAASAGGSVVGLIALIRTLGRSRAQADIDQLWDQLKASELRLAESHPAKP